MSASVEVVGHRDDDHDELFGWWTDGSWHDLRSAEVTTERDLLGVPASAQDVRTWNATVLMAPRPALELGTHPPSPVAPTSTRR